MALPLLWLGAGLLATYAGSQLAREQQKNAGHVAHFPGDHPQPVEPVNGAIVCCGIYEVFQHTGIWVDDNIVELKGNGLIRAISPQRFLAERSGNCIYIACDNQMTPLVDTSAASRALSQVFQYSDYDVIKNNCHRFVAQAISGRRVQVTRFGELNAFLYQQFQSEVYWQPLKN